MRELLIAETREADTERNDPATALVMRDRLLAALARSMQSLLGSERDGFADAVRDTLGALGEACGIHRVKVIMQRPAPEDGAPTHFLDHEWWAPGLASQASLGLTRFPNTAITEWTRVLERGRAIWYLIDEVPAPLRSAFESVGVQSVGAVPIFGAGRYLGLIAFDDCAARRVWSDAEIDALTAAARTLGGAIHQHHLQQAMLAERDRRIAAEQARAEESARLAERVNRHAQLLAAVAASADDLLAADDPLTCVDAILARLSERSGALRAGLNRFDWTPDDTDLLGWQEVVHEWAAPGALRQMETPLQRFPMRRDDATYAAFEREFRATGRLVIQIAEQAERYRTEQQGLGVVWSLAVPFIVDGAIWGALGFDYATPFVRHEEAELSALQTVASSIAEALTRQRLQACALATERARADENARMARLLTNVVHSSRVLIDAAPDAFETALHRWLGLFARETDAIRASVYDLVEFEATGQRTARMLCEWVREGAAGSIPVSFAQPFVFDPRDAQAFFERMMSGEVIAIHVDEAEGGMRELLVSQGNATVVTVPVFIDGAQWGNLSFDFAERYALDGPMVAVLLTAADTLAAMIKRNEATRTALAERDRRIASERARADESARYAARTERHSALLAAVAASAEELLAAREPRQCLDAVLERVARVTHAMRACVARIDWLPDDPSLHGWQEIVHEWSSPGTVRQMAGPMQRFAMTRADASWERALAQFATERRIIAAIADTDEPFRSQQSALGVVWTLCYPILIEGRIWGLLGMDYATRFEDDDGADMAALQTLASTIADALSRQQLEQRTLEAERSRTVALRRANDELMASTSRLAALNDIPAFLDHLLLAMTRSCGARSGALFAATAADKALLMRRCVMDDAVVAIDTDERMRLWRRPLPEWLCKAWREQLGGESVIRAPLTGPGSPDEWADNARWHARFGHRLRLRFPLNVGGELLGIIVLSLTHDDAPGDFLLQQAVALAQQAGIALQMERLARQVESTAVRTERERMAAEIHDNLAQSFTSIAMQSESLAGLLADDAEKSAVLRLIERTAREGLAEARLSVLALLPADGWPGSLDRSLEALAERSSIRGGIACRFEASGRPCAIGGVAQESLLRIAQEATSNAMRHSGGTRVRIRLDYDARHVRLAIEDDGRGLPGPGAPRQNGGFGVSGMANRAAAIGGTVTLAGSALGGLAVCVDLPCPAAQGGDA